MADPFVAEIRIFPFSFAPKGWAFCNGQILPLSQNTALFSLLGTMYGGDGKTNFALPNFQDSVAMGAGQGPGLTERFPGESGGSETVTLLITEMPAHTHQLQGFDNSLAKANSSTPANNVVFARANNLNPYQSNTTQQLGQMAVNAVGMAGQNQPHNNMMPFLVMNHCIALQGVFPPRS